MVLSPFMEENQEPAFKFDSVFSYSRIPTSDDRNGLYGEPDKSDSKGTIVARGVLMSIIYAVFLVTFPLSVWFCIKKVKSLQRCIIFRLGKRLPLKGPGLVITFPCIDVVDTVDLHPCEFVVSEDEQLLTSDGSVVEIVKFQVTLSVANAIKSFTQLKDSKTNVQQFIKLSFTNVVVSSHVEDLERKIDWIVKDFVNNCNDHIDKWGWDITCQDVPKFKVINRAEPQNAIMTALKGYFNPGGNQENTPENAFRNMLQQTALATGMTSTSPSSSTSTSTSTSAQPTDDPFFLPMQSVAKKYCSLSMLGFETVTLQIEIRGVKTYNYSFATQSGQLTSLPGVVSEDAVQMKVSGNSTEDIMDYINSGGESTRVEVKNNLF